jgi:hypothetical protein
MLAGATVLLYQQADSSAFLKGTTSDASGKFEFSNLQNSCYQLRFIFIGYENF